MNSKVTILGHPVHPMLVAYPIAFYTAAFGGYLIFHFNGDRFWFDVGIAATIAGVIAAAIAAIPGVIDWLVGIPRNSPAKRHGLIHMILNTAAVPFMIVNSAIHTSHWSDPSHAGWGIFLALIALLLTIAAGFYGWTMVQGDHIGTHPEGAQDISPAL